VESQERWLGIKEIVGAALEREPSERGAFLDQACSNDGQLRAEVESLLAAHADTGVLSRIAWGTTVSEPAGQVGTIEPYRLIQELGVGGMGQVWLAEQTEPVRRRIALKLIKAGMYDATTVQRFQAERQSLAIMEHPAIAKVFDAGATPQGQPYFAMEYVDGPPITIYCDRKKLSIPERLRLLAQVCEGVQHAHQKAIIHRDLKPSNILVTEIDGNPTPRIIDFGLAKASVPLGGQTSFTQAGVFIGTPGYISPEQIDPNLHDVDTRTDVYSLGVVLYELLTGDLPFDTAQWKKQNLDEVLRQLRETDPQRPSTKISTNRETITARAEARHTEPRQLVNQLRGDLDWITLKALEKDRERRYGTPSELAADIQRYLENKPVVARPSSRIYRVRKYIQRHRVVVTAAATLFLLLSGLAVRESLQARRIARERDRANLEAETAKETADFLVGLFEVADPGEARGNSVTAKEILDRASQRIDSGLERQPLIQARLQLTMAQVYKGLGLYNSSVQLAERSWKDRRSALGDADAATLAARSELGDSLRCLGKLNEAETHLRAALEAQRTANKPESLDFLVTEARLGIVLYNGSKLKDADGLLVSAVTGLRRLGPPGAPELVDALQWLGQTLRDEDKREEAVAVQLESLGIAQTIYGSDHPSTLSALDALGLLYWDLGRLNEAESYLRQSLEASRRVLGSDHTDTLTTTLNLGLVLLDRQKYADGETAFRAALDGYRKTLGADHAFTLTAMGNLCSDLTLQKKFAEAEPVCQQALAARRRTLGEDHRSTLMSIDTLGVFYLAAHRLGEAESTFREAYERRRRVLGPDNSNTLISMGHLGETVLERGRTKEAAELLNTAVERARATLPPTDLTLPNLLTKWGRCLLAMERKEEAKSTLQDAIRLYSHTLSPEDSRTRNAEKLLAQAN
jgi:non-specific serine/threonine protein kinase/serine/threonine-protein kinase